MSLIFYFSYLNTILEVMYRETKFLSTFRARARARVCVSEWLTACPGLSLLSEKFPLYLFYTRLSSLIDKKQLKMWNVLTIWVYCILYNVISIHSFSILSDDRSKASSKTMPPYSAIQSLLLQMRISSSVLKVIQ